jgi:hypothetical protein
MIIGIIGLITLLALSNMLYYEIRVIKFDKNQDLMEAYCTRRFKRKYGSHTN